MLTIREIDDLCRRMDEVVGGSYVLGNKISAIKIIREGLGLGLREAKDYCDAYFPGRIRQKFRDDLLGMAGLSGKLTVSVYDNSMFRLEVKDPAATFEDLERFLQTAWNEMHRPA